MREVRLEIACEWLLQRVRELEMREVASTQPDEVGLDEMTVLKRRVRELEELAYWLRPRGPASGETWKAHAESLQREYDQARTEARERVRELEQQVQAISLNLDRCGCPTDESGSDFLVRIVHERDTYATAIKALPRLSDTDIHAWCEGEKAFVITEPIERLLRLRQGMGE